MRRRIRWLGAVFAVVLTWAGGTVSYAAREVDLDTFVILVQPMSAIDAQKQKLKAEGRLTDENLPVYRPRVGDLVEILAVRNESGFVVPQRWMLAKLFRSGEDKFWGRALFNTGHFAQPVAVQKGQGGLSIVTAQNDLTPSVLLYDPLWSQAALAGEGETVVAVDKVELVVGHTGSPGQMRRLRKMVQLGADAPGLIAKTLLVRRQGHWATYP